MAKKIQDLEKKSRQPSSTGKTQIAPTPRPWETYACHVYAAGEDGGNVCSMSDPHAKTTVGYSPLSVTSPGIKQAYANAELICRAVNSFDELLEAARHWSVCDFPDEIDFRCDGCNKARAALEKAEAK